MWQGWGELFVGFLGLVAASSLSSPVKTCQWMGIGAGRAAETGWFLVSSQFQESTGCSGGLWPRGISFYDTQPLCSFDGRRGRSYKGAVGWSLTMEKGSLVSWALASKDADHLIHSSSPSTDSLTLCLSPSASA